MFSYKHERITPPTPKWKENIRSGKKCNLISNLPKATQLFKTHSWALNPDSWLQNLPAAVPLPEPTSSYWVLTMGQALCEERSIYHQPDYLHSNFGGSCDQHPIYRKQPKLRQA